MMTPTEQQLRQQLEIQNLTYALRRGWHTDPRWREALGRILREQEQEVDDEKRKRSQSGYPILSE